MSHRFFSYCNISSSCFLVFYFTHGCPPVQQQPWMVLLISQLCLWNKEPFMGNNAPATTSLSILPPLLGRYYWESWAHQFGPQMTFSSWPNPDKLSVLLKKGPFIIKRKEERMREGKREREGGRERKVKKLMSQWHPFSHNRGNFCSITGSG